MVFDESSTLPLYLYDGAASVFLREKFGKFFIFFQLFCIYRVLPSVEQISWLIAAQLIGR
jgi:hypothetical protein